MVSDRGCAGIATGMVVDALVALMLTGWEDRAKPFSARGNDGLVQVLQGIN